MSIIEYRTVGECFIAEMSTIQQWIKESCIFARISLCETSQVEVGAVEDSAVGKCTIGESIVVELGDVEEWKRGCFIFARISLCETSQVEVGAVEDSTVEECSIWEESVIQELMKEIISIVSIS